MKNFSNFNQNSKVICSLIQKQENKKRSEYVLSSSYENTLINVIAIFIFHAFFLLINFAYL